MQEGWTGADATALRIVLGLSQSQFAKRTGVHVSTVKKWASRGKTVTLPTLFGEMIDTHLARATAEQRARFAAAVQARTRIAPADESPDSVVQQWNPGVWAADCSTVAQDLTREDLLMDRRQAGRALLGVVVGASLFEPMERWMLRTTKESAAAADELGGAGVQKVMKLENAARVFREWDDENGGGLMRKAVIGQLHEVSDLVEETSSQALKRRLTAVVAQLAETAATMSWDSGQQAKAQNYYVLAVRAATAAGDSLFAANAMAGMARQLLCLNRASDALELIRLAQDFAGGAATPTLRSMFRTREAWAYAKLGRPSAFQRASDRAHEALADSSPESEPHWIQYFDQAELVGTMGGRLLDMAQLAPKFASEAAENIDKAIALRRPDRWRSSALDKLGLTEARFIEGEFDDACRIGNEAMADVERTGSDRVQVQLREMFTRTERLSNVRSVADLRDRMRPLLAGTV